METIIEAPSLPHDPSPKRAGKMNLVDTIFIFWFLYKLEDIPTM